MDKKQGKKKKIIIKKKKKSKSKSNKLNQLEMPDTPPPLKVEKEKKTLQLKPNQSKIVVPKKQNIHVDIKVEKVSGTNVCSRAEVD